MEEETLETVVDDWEDLSVEESTISDSKSDPLTIIHSGDIIINNQDEDVSEKTTEETLEEYVGGLKTESVSRNSRSVSIDSEQFTSAWTLSYNDEDIVVLFPEQNELTVIDGKIANLSNTDITGTVIPSGGVDLSTYFRRTVTIRSLTSANSQNSSYRYGAHGYITEYSPYTATQLQTSVVYSDFEVVERPAVGSGWKSDTIIIIALLFLSVLFSIVGGLLRRD